MSTKPGQAQRTVPSVLVETAFCSLAQATKPLTGAVLNAYEAQYVGRPDSVRHAEAAPVTAFSPTGPFPLFRGAVESGRVDPATYNAMWVSAAALQGGSRNQLELPRGGHRFFGFSFGGYDHPHDTIGHLQLRMGSQHWADRRLTWHGNNRMERLNLPTQTQGGPPYGNSVLMFRRLEVGAFELIVTPRGSDLANAWATASAQDRCLFTLGTRATSRLVGLLR